MTPVLGFANLTPEGIDFALEVASFALFFGQRCLSLASSSSLRTKSFLSQASMLLLQIAWSAVQLALHLADSPALHTLEFVFD